MGSWAGGRSRQLCKHLRADPQPPMCHCPPPAPPALPACPADDEQFKEEKAVIIKEISLLQPPAAPQPQQ